MRDYIPGIVVIVLALILAGLGFFLGNTAKPTYPKYEANDPSEMVDSLEKLYNANVASAESAVQQQVCIGWFTNDLLKASIAANYTNTIGIQRILENQEAILDSNRKMTMVIWVSLAVVLLAFGAYVILNEIFGYA